MTSHRDFKQLVRARMDKTGERYTAARAALLSGSGPELTAAIGGQQPDLAAARNLCASAGATGPEGQPLTEAMAFGLAGGVGFLYGVFEYDTGPTMTIVARNASLPDAFCEPLFDRLGLATEVVMTTGAKKAATTLDAALDAGRRALCTVGAGALPYLGLPPDESSMSPHLVGVVGRGPAGDGATVLLDDRSPEPIEVARSDLDAARRAYTRAKQRMVTIPEPGPDDLDWAATVEAAVAAGAAGFDTPPVPQFRANVGLAGLAKFRQLLTATGAKSWSSVFGSGRAAAIGLSRLVDGIDHAYTAPGAGRALYADFLDEAVAVSDRPAWRSAAELFRTSGAQWSALAATAAAAHPDLARHAELADERAAELDRGAPDPATMLALTTEQWALVDGCDLSAEAARATFEALADPLDRIIEAETHALAELRTE